MPEGTRSAIMKAISTMDIDSCLTATKGFFLMDFYRKIKRICNSGRCMNERYPLFRNGGVACGGTVQH
jgi:hypothetical protein